MRRANHLLEKIIDPDNLRLAAWKAGKGKRHSKGVLRYSENLECNLSRLRQQIETGEIEVGNYHFFKIWEPKERQICASPFAEQVLHHAMMNVCHARFERHQIFDSYASRTGKGTSGAIERAQHFSKKHDWFLKLDVRKFFESIPHAVLKTQLKRLFKDSRVTEISEKIIDSYETTPDRGLPIGNLTSQYFANHFLSELDHFITEKIAPGGYVRYMDDMVLWHDDRQFLKNALAAIQKMVENELLSKLKPELLNRTASGLPFLGFRIFPNQVRLTRQSLVRFARKMNVVEINWQSGFWDETICQGRVLPLLAFVKPTDNLKLKQRLRA